MNNGPALVQATHHLLNDVRNAEPPPDVLTTATGLITQACDVLKPYVWQGPYAVEQLKPPSESTLNYDPADLAGLVPFSSLLGRRNPAAPRSTLRSENGIVLGSICFSSIHAGPMGLVHGGIISGLLDEILAIAMIAKGFVGFTKSINIQFHAPTKLGHDIDIWAECAGRSGSELLGRAELRSAGKATASALGVFKWMADRDTDFYAKPALGRGQEITKN